MIRVFGNLLRLTVFLAVGTAFIGAQNAPSNPAPSDLAARADSPSTPMPDTASASPAQASAGQQAQIAEALEALKAQNARLESRIEQLETELHEQRAMILADSQDTAALKSAEKALLAGNGATALRAVLGAAAAGQTAPAEATPVPEIPAQVTTLGEAFPDDMTWVNNNGHQKDSPMATKYFTPEIRFDANYTIDYNHPKDDTLGGSTETFRSDEWQLDTLAVGGDFRVDNVRGRILTMDGMYATTTARNDPSVARGSWDLAGAYKYIAEGWGGYHWNVQHGVNVDAGIFASYIGLFSYYNFDNWTYQPSYVSSNTPWFFNGMRLQWFPTARLKIEPWFINGWQSYARSNGKPGLGGQILWIPKPNLYFVFNNYGLGEDDPGYPGRSRFHADYSTEIKYYDHPERFLDKIAMTLTGDMGCEYGGGPPVGTFYANGSSPMTGTGSTYTGGVNCHNDHDGKPKQSFLGWMTYQRLWFKKDLYAITIGGGSMNNPGRYLTLLPPINAATAVTGTPYFTSNPGDKSNMLDSTFTFDYMPSQFITMRLEEGYRYAFIPYWTGHGGITPPGGDNGNPADYQCAAGGDAGYGYGAAGQAAAILNCQNLGLANGYTTPGDLRALWWPDLRKQQIVSTLAILVRF